MSEGVTISAELHERLLAESKRLDVSMSSLVEAALAPALGTTPPTARRARSSKRRRFASPCPPVIVSTEVHAQLRSEAARRGTTICALVTAIVDAALDDLEGGGSWPFLGEEVASDHRRAA